ncbi:hypothetical protein FRC10_005085 [Ceratobasidium sp. 414]|nr:hypothetical protein FRC10_005085 [Ceratobasidium sp. 414]
MHFLPLLAFALVSSASPLSVDFRTRHALREVPSGWTAVASAPAEHLIDMRIGLKQARMDELLATLYEVSDPAHARYGMHLSKAEVEELVAPRDETVKAVEEWLDVHGVKVAERSPAGDWLHVLVPVARAEQMLNTRYNVYRHTSGNHIVRAESYALPRSLDEHVDLVQPTTFFGKIHERGPELAKRASTLFVAEPVSANAALDCNSTITPACLKSLYKTEGYRPTSNRNSLGITGYLGKSPEQYASRSDLQMFYKKYAPEAVGRSFAFESVNGGLDNQAVPGSEANLDIQYGSAISYPTPNTFYSTGGRGRSDTSTTNEPYIEWVHYMLAKQTLPSTISTSYGDDEQTVPLDYARSVCNAFVQLGARGVSLLFSSGDSGVGSGECLTSSVPPKKRFVPTFPATCHAVTAVGGTYGISPEIGVPFSQGGFSDYFSMPGYQSSAVAKFKASLGTQYQGMYNETGRGFPDVSAQGRNFQVIVGGLPVRVSGTSASCPTFAGVISLLNDYRLAQGKSPLGFLNPWLYANPGMLNDITNGNNPGCGTSGFNAMVGWDPVTGLGTPDFLKMKQIV